MRLHLAARRFDKSDVTDAYTGAFLFKGQISAQEYYKLDGAAVGRRMISVAPGVSIPTRKAITLGGNTFILGDPSVDQWANSPIRTQYIANETPYLASVKTIAEALSGSPGLSAYAAKTWNKDINNAQESSEYFGDYHIFFAHDEPVSEGAFIQVEGRWHLCHSSHRSLAGFRDAVCSELAPDALQTVTLGASTYNPVTDSYTVTPATVNVLRVKWRQHYQYFSAAQEEYQRGDETVFVLKAQAATVKPSDTLALSDGAWRVLSVVSHDALTFALHTRRV